MQVFASKEKIGTLTKTGNTTVQLSSSVITLGAKQYSTGNLVCDITTDLDTGSVQSSKSYYVYAVVVSGSVALRASLSTSPLGFVNFVQVGALYTNNSSQVDYIADIDSNGVIKRKPFYERKTMTTVYSGTNLGIMDELTFNNLEIGRRYKAKYLLRLLGNYNNTNAIFTGFVLNGGQTRQWGHSFWTSNQGLTNFHEINWEFTAEATTLTIQLDTARGNDGQNSNSQVRPEDTYAELTELENIELTDRY